MQSATKKIPPHARLTDVSLGDSRWTSGFWAGRFENCRESMVPTMHRLMTDSERHRFIGNFEVACGAIEGKHRGPRWNDGDFYKWLEGAAAVYALTRDPALDAEMDKLIQHIARAQRADGYIHTDIQIRQRNGETVAEFDNPMDFEMYNMGHLMSAACVHHHATGKRNLLDLAIKSAQFLDGVFADPKPSQARHGICPGHLMGLCDLYRVTGEKKHLKLAERLLNMRDLVEKGDDDNQDRVKLRDQRVAHGHGVRATYLYAGAADIYQEIGDETLLPPLKSVWDDLVAKKLYITGGCGALYDGASPDGTEDQLNITRIHQAFGRNYQLPQSTAHNETCAAIGSVLWSWRMLEITGDAKYADLVELTMLNSVLAGVSLDGTAFFYTNTLRQLDPMPVDLRWVRHRTKSMGCWCCPPNVVRTVAESSQFAYAIGKDAVYTVMYGAGKLETTLPGGATVKLSQTTEYPWGAKITIRIESAGEFALNLRIPAWCNDATVRLNNEKPASATPGYRTINRRWSAGDVIELNLPMPVKLIEAHPLVEEARNHLAVMRGPVVYCLESADLPKDVKLLDVRLPRTAKLTPQNAGDDLSSVTVLRGKAVASPQSDWSNNLYREASTPTAREIDVTLIPYFAWDNRGEHEMSVWLPTA